MAADAFAHYASLLYVSEVASGSGAHDVPAITRASRINNRRDGITGLLVYDGESFAQLVQGPRERIDALLERLQRDPRHGSIDILLHESCDDAPHFANWQLGFLTLDCDRAGLASLRGLRGLRGAPALAAFLGIVPALELLARERAGHPVDPGTLVGV